MNTEEGFLLREYCFIRFALFIAMLVTVAVYPSESQAQSTPGSIVTGAISPAPVGGTAVQLPPATLAALHRGILERRERVAALVDNNPPSPPGLELPPGRPTEAVDSWSSDLAGAELEFSLSDLVVGRNNLNTSARTAGFGSTLAEPSAVNEGSRVFYTGNTHAEYSVDGGATWTNAPLHSGPADAPIACCDMDVIYDQARGVAFWHVLYVNDLLTNGVVKITVRRNGLSSADSCSYNVDPGGTANNILPDYPHLGISNKYLYLTTNNISSTGGWAGAQVRRFDIDQMAQCLTASSTTFTYGPAVATGQRVFVPVEGARDAMYWGMLENATTFRLFRWLESSAAPTSVLRSIATSTHTNPDCRGGVDNFDFIERSTAWSITGFRMRGAVGLGSSGNGRIAFYWNVGPDGSHVQGHVHAAVFQESTFTLLAQPHIFSQQKCFGYPAVSANEQGDLGLSIASGGRNGGGGTAAQGYVALDDEYTTGIGYFGAVFLTASGTHNRPDDRYGDYMSVRNHEPCDLWFVATNYSLSGGADVSNVNARYVEFGRGRNKKCYDRWRSVKATNP